MFYNISSTPKSETIILNGLINDTNFKLTDNKTLNNENGITNENLFKNYFSFTFNYMQDKARKVAQLYNDSCKDYKEIYDQLVNLFSPYLVEGGKYKLGSNEYDSIDVLLSISDDDLEFQLNKVILFNNEHVTVDEYIDKASKLFYMEYIRKSRKDRRK